MIYFSWNPGTVVDLEGRPMAAGRVTVYVHDSNVLATVYTLEGSSYVVADNPQLLDDAGRLSATLFAEIGIYDVKIEKDNGDGTYEDFDNFEIGIDSSTIVGGSGAEAPDVEALTEMNPDDVGNLVTVMSAPVRTYFWDPDSVDTPDGGIVVDSNVKGEGNWILVFDGAYLPSSVYGVKDGDVTNINSLFNYATTVGSANIATPPAILLEQGTYNVPGTYICNKHLAFAPGAKIASGTVQVKSDIEVFGARTGYLGDIKYINAGCTAKLSWFRTRTGFRDCGASYLFVDSDNTTDNATVTVTNKELHYSMAKPAWLNLNDCVQIHGDSGLVYSDIVQASDVLKVGNLFRIIPHEEEGLTTKYYDVYSQGNDNYLTMRIGDDQNVIFYNGIDVRAGISIPRSGHPQQWWGYFEGSDNPQIQIDAEGSIDVTGHVKAGTVEASNSMKTKSMTITGSTVTSGNVDVGGHLIYNYGFFSDHRSMVFVSEDTDISVASFKNAYEDGSTVKIVNYGNESITVTVGTSETASVGAHRFIELVKYSGAWYREF